MAPFLFGSIEPNASKNRYWFASAFLVLLAGFFSLGLSISPSNSVNVNKSNYNLTFKKAQNPIVVTAKPKAKIILIDKKKLEEEQKQAEAARIAAEAAKAQEEAKIVQNSQIETVSYPVAALSAGSLTDLYKRAAAAYGLDWRVLAAVHMIESGQATECAAVSYAGATGPMQFLPSTFNAYAVDGDGDGVTNICDVDDAVFSAANLLATNWGATDITAALYHYNNSDYYVNEVLALANSL